LAHLHARERACPCGLSFSPFKPSGHKLADFYFIEQEEPEKVLGIILKLVKERIAKRFGFDPIGDIQVKSK
jgi:exodeoxyribonuclease V alpha subunit